MIRRRETKSGVRWDVRFRVHGGKEVSKTFRTRREAERFERDQRSKLDQGQWVDIRLGSVDFGDFSAIWLEERTLSARTRDTYKTSLRLHIIPTFGATPISKIASPDIRSWNSKLVMKSPSVAAKAYRLLRAILNTAVEDGLIGRNPCQIKGASEEHSKERPVIGVSEFTQAVKAVPERWRAGILLAGWCLLRRGELLALERRDFDLAAGTVKVERSGQWMKGGFKIGPPKTAAGYRTVPIPPHVMPEIERHLNQFVGPEPTSIFLTGKQGGRLRSNTLLKAWKQGAASVGRTDLVLHDLRHSGSSWTASVGASMKDLMKRGGWSSYTSVMRYQHSTTEREIEIAESLGALATQAGGNDDQQSNAGQKRDGSESHLVHGDGNPGDRKENSGNSDQAPKSSYLLEREAS